MTQVPASSHGGGFTPASCVLAVPTLNVASAARHGCKWTQLYDNIYDFGVLAALPSGIGVSAAHDGSDETITTTLAGMWAFTMAVRLSGTDATWLGELSADDNWTSEQLANESSGATTVQPETVLSQVVALPTGALITPSITGAVAATGALTALVRMVIVRLA